MTKFPGNCRFGHIYWRIPFLKTSFFVQFYAYFFKNFSFAYFLGTHNSRKILLEAPGLYFLHLEFDRSHSSVFGKTVVQGQHSARRLVNFGLLVKMFAGLELTKNFATAKILRVKRASPSTAGEKCFKFNMEICINCVKKMLIRSHFRGIMQLLLNNYLGRWDILSLKKLLFFFLKKVQ